jgi:hypothetical protein
MQHIPDKIEKNLDRLSLLRGLVLQSTDILLQFPTVNKTIHAFRTSI